MDELAKVMGARTAAYKQRNLAPHGSKLPFRLHRKVWDTEGPWVHRMPDNADLTVPSLLATASTSATQYVSLM